MVPSSPQQSATAAFRKEADRDTNMVFAVGDLAHALLKQCGVKPPFFQDPITSTYSPVMHLTSWIYHLPTDHRKAILDACRIRAPIWINKTLSQSFTALRPVTIFSLDESESPVTIYCTDLASILDSIIFSPHLLSLLSYFVRAEGTVHLQEFTLEKDKSLDKELAAALCYQTFEQKLDYSTELVF